MVIVYGVTRIDYQPLFGKWARAPPPKVLLGRPDTRDRRKSSLRYYLKTKNILVVLSVSDELTWNLSMLFSRPGKIDCITWRLGRSRSRCFWREHVVFAVLCLGLWSPRIVNCWLKLEYATFQNTEANIFALVVFARSLGIELDGIIWKKGTCWDWCTNVVEGFDRWLYLKTEFFLVLARSLLTEFDGITWKQWGFVLVVFGRSLFIEFDGITCSFCFRENVVNRIWWHLLKQRFFHCTFCEIYWYNSILVPRNHRWWNLTALSQNKKDFALVVKTFETNYNKQISVFNEFFLPH